MAGVVTVLRSFVVFAAALLLVTGAAAQRVEDLRPQFGRETDPVRKARLFPKVGEMQLDLVRSLATQEKYPEALAALEQYRDDARVTHAALKSSGINAEKKPGGFKQFQIHLRKGARHVTDTIAALPFEQRESFQAIEKEIEKLDQELILMLFPRQPGRKPEDSKSKNQE